MIDAFARTIDRINEQIGKWAALGFIPLTVIITIEVISRRFFSKPTIWAWDINIQISAMLVVLGGAFLLIENGHIIVDVIVNQFPFRARKVVDIITSAFFFLGVGVVFWFSCSEAARSISMGERLSTLFEPPLAPLRVVIAMGFFLLLLQGIARLIRDIRMATTGRALEPAKPEVSSETREVTG